MKIDSVTKEPLAGAAFIVERSNGEKIGTYKTDTAGKVIVPDLPEGTYIVSETTAPDGYMLSEVPKTVVVVSGRLSTIEFTNKPYSGIEIIKTDAVTHNPLAGATFTVERANGEKIGTYKSDSAGKIIVPDLKEGTYIVSEIIAPDGYMLNETPKTINVVSGKLATVTFVNKPHSGIEIIKTNSVTHDPLAGATFTVERVNGEKIGTYKTDSSGKIIVSDLPEGTYIVSETIAPDGYMLNESPKTVNVVSGKLVTVTFANKPYSGIEIIKTDSVTHDSLAGATFTVESVNGEKIGTYKTDSTGKIIVSDLPEGTYIVSETIAPDGYMLNESPKTVNVVSGKLATVMFANKPYSGIEIIKTDSVTHNPLAGATFTVESVNDEKIGTYKTDSSGKIIVSDLPEGTYIISETIAPNGYMLNESPKTVNVVSGKLATVTFANKPYSGIEIIKTDAVTHNPLAGATFTVEGVNGEKIGTYKTDSSGKIIVSDLPEGTYIISETIAPDGYMLNESPKTVNVVSGKLATVMFANKPYSGIEIIKTDSVTHNPLADATFTVEGVNGEKIGTYKTDSSGKIIVSDLPEGTYIVSETIAPDGYMLNESPKTVNVVSGKLATVTFANKPYSGIEIIKTDAVTHNPLSGAIFTVEHANGEKIGTYKTDSSGKVIVSELPEGTYIVSETIAPNGYILDGLPKTVIVKSGKLTIAEFANKPLAGLKIIKLDSVTHNPISGVEFVITKMTGEKIENDFRGYTFKTDRTGQIYVPGLMDGYYTVTEVKAAEGYILDGEPKTILIQSDAKTGKPLAGVVFDIRHADGSFVTGRILDGNQPGTEANSPNKTTSTNGDITGSYTTDANGRILLNGLESGQYMVTERKALDGYELDTDVYNVTVVTGKLATLNLTNKPKGGIRLVKIDSMTQKPIQGVEFMLFDSDKKVVDVFYTDDNGVIDISDGIAEGRYTIRETRAVKGYDLDTNPRTVEFKGGVVTEIVWENTPQLGQIQITKKSGDGNEINGMPKGTLLEGAVYEVYDYRTGNLVDRFVTGNNGVAVSSMLPLGRYLIKEVKAPQYYKLSGKVLDIEIEYSGQIIRREMVNYSVSLGVYIKKTGNYEAMSGDNIRYRVKAVQNTSNIALSDFYWRDVLPTDAVRLSKIVTGTYNQSLKYKIMATTSKGDSIIIADNLSTLKNHVIDCSRDDTSDAKSITINGDEYSIELAKLDLSEKYLTNPDIDSLKYMVNLTELSLFNNQISDISVLQNLTSLESLDLSFNPISDIKALQGLTNLRTLNLRCTRISDISILINLWCLESLDLSFNRISEISALRDSFNLKSLNLNLNEVSDISPLLDLRDLKNLYLGGNQITDISALQGLENLTNLFIQGNYIPDEQIDELRAFLPDCIID
ncbi:colossin-b-related [Holotrichia oblita]|nr:colossin-b-related [Holotrichia oblita]